MKLIVADQLGLEDIEEQAINFMVENELDADIVKGKAISSDLWFKLFKSVFDKLKEKM